MAQHYLIFAAGPYREANLQEKFGFHQKMNGDEKEKREAVTIIEDGLHRPVALLDLLVQCGANKGLQPTLLRCAP